MYDSAVSDLTGNSWFCECSTLDEARAEYRRLCFLHHPDHGGDTLVMQAINLAYNQFQRRLAGPRAAGQPRSWEKARQRPRDVPWPEAQGRQHEPQPVHSRDYFLRLWNHAPWERQPHGGWIRRLLNHSVTVFQHSDPRFEGSWFVLLDDVFSPYFYDNRAEAEQAGFELLYQKVKYQTER